MDTESIYRLGEITVLLSGPLLLATVLFMFASVYLRTGKFPSPLQALYEYAKLNIRTRNHAGVLVYGFIACMMLFIAGVALLLFAKLSG